jgi:hypothetical protein
MTFPMLDHLHNLNDVFTGGIFVLSMGALFSCFRFMSFGPGPVIAHRSA